MNILFPLFAVLIWSVNAIISKVSAGVIDPAAISFYRWVLAFLILSPFTLPRILRNHNRNVIIPHMHKLLILGMLGMVLYQALAYFAAQTVSAVFMGIASSLIPVLTLIFSIGILKLVPTVPVCFGIALSCFGLAWVVTTGKPMDLFTHKIGSGEIMMLIASSAYALYSVLTRHWALNIPMWQSIYVQIFFGIIMLTPGFLIAENIALNMKNIPLVLFAGIPASLIAPYLWLQGVMRLGASKASIFMNLTPVFTVIIAMIFLNEKMEHYHFFGISIILIGVTVAQMPYKKAEKK